MKKSDVINLKFSVIIILEEASHELFGYLNTLNMLFSETGERFEIIIIANGVESFLKSKATNIESLKANIKCFSFKKYIPTAAALKAGLTQSTGEIVFLTGSYQQITDESLRSLLMAGSTGIDVVIPWRQDRVDPWFNGLQSKVFNKLVSMMTKLEIHDLSCTTRLIRRQAIENIEFYGGLYRFLPILASVKGYKILEIKCSHFKEHGKSGLYTFSEYLSRIVDIFTLYFNTRFTRKPLRFFNLLGSIFLLFGIVTCAYVFAQKILFNLPIGGRPVLLMAILFMVIGAQAISIGLLAEIVAFTHGRHKKEYIVEKII